MKLVNQRSGFTIVEALIVLSVMGLLFAIAISSMLSYLHQNAFYSSVNDLQQQIQAEISKFSDGQYKSVVGTQGFNCTASASGPPKLTPVTGDQQGTNTGCEFAGIAMRFGYNADNPTNSLNSITFYPLVANECLDSTYSLPGSLGCIEALSNLSGANSQVVTLTTNAAAPNTEASTFYDLENNLKLAEITENGVVLCSQSTTPTCSQSTTPTAIVSGFAVTSLGLGQSGPVSYALYAFNSPDPAAPTMGEYFNGAISPVPGGTLSPLNTVELCFASGSTNNQYGIVNIGNSTSASGLGVTSSLGSSC